MEKPARGRPRVADIEHVALEQTLAILEERGYDGLRMKDVAATAGIGLGAMYRRWPGKQDLVAAALRAGIGAHPAPVSADPEADLIAALLRVSDAVPRGLGQLVGVCLTDPDSELAQVAREAKLDPMTHELAARLERVTGPADDLHRRAEQAVAGIVWHTAVHADPPDEKDIREKVLPILLRR